MENKIEQAIEDLTEKAENAHGSDAAMKYSQAVVSLTHGLKNLKEMKDN